MLQCLNNLNLDEYFLNRIVVAGIVTGVLVLSLILVPFSLTSLLAFGSTIESPRKQMEKGVAPEDVVCREGKFLMKRPSDKIACVYGTSISVLENRDWELKINLDCDTVDNSNWHLPTNKYCGLNNFDKVVRFTSG